MKIEKDIFLYLNAEVLADQPAEGFRTEIIVDIVDTAVILLLVGAAGLQDSGITDNGSQRDPVRGSVEGKDDHSVGVAVFVRTASFVERRRRGVSGTGKRLPFVNAKQEIMMLAKVVGLDLIPGDGLNKLRHPVFGQVGICPVIFSQDGKRDQQNQKKTQEPAHRNTPSLQGYIKLYYKS